MKKLNLLIISMAFLLACTGNQQNNQKQAEIVEEQAENNEDWVVLSEGDVATNWRGVNMTTFLDSGWQVENGVMKVLEGKPGDNIITREMYADFELVLEFKLTEDANSGIKYFVLENDYAEGQALGLEYQVIDNNKIKGDLENNTHKLASLYDLYPSKQTAPNPVGEWNEVRILAQGDQVEHWLNGKKVLSYQRGSQEYRNRIADSKFAKYDNFGEASAGHIMLQDHSDEVSFRNVKIRILE
jgi:hypothetical protein